MRKDADGLEYDGECPQHFKQGRRLDAVKDQGDDRASDQRGSQRVASQLPCPLPLPSPSINPGHQNDDVDGGPYVEVFQDEVPPRPLRRHPEQVKISRAKDRNIEQLGKEGYAW